MDHQLAAAQNMTERYLLDELDPAARDEFEEHYFNCMSARPTFMLQLCWSNGSEMEPYQNPRSTPCLRRRSRLHRHGSHGCALRFSFR